jgi:hypothetical protein
LSNGQKVPYRISKFILVPASQQTIGHQTLGKPTVYREYVAEFLAGLPKR